MLWNHKYFRFSNLSLPKCSLESFFNTGQISSKNSKTFWSFRLEKATEVDVFSRMNDQETLNIILPWYQTQTQGNPIFRVNSGFGFIFGSLWYFITKYDRCYLKMRQLFYYEMWQKFITKCVKLFITNCNSFITNCGSCYELRR